MLYKSTMHAYLVQFMCFGLAQTEKINTCMAIIILVNNGKGPAVIFNSSVAAWEKGDRGILNLKGGLSPPDLEVFAKQHQLPKTDINFLSTKHNKM